MVDYPENFNFGPNRPRVEVGEHYIQGSLEEVKAGQTQRRRERLVVELIVHDV